MKICIFSTTFFPNTGGAERFAHGLGTNLQRLGQEVFLLVPADNKMVDDFSKFYKILPLKLLKIGKLGKRFVEMVLFFNLVYYHFKYKFNAIQGVVLYEPGYVASIFGKIFKIPTFVRPTGEDIQFEESINYGKIADPVYKHKVTRAFNFCSKIVSISPTIKLDILKFGNKLSLKIVEIFNGVEIQRFDIPIKMDLEEKFKIPKKAKILFSVGRNVPKKDYATMIKAFAIVSKKYDDFVLALAGVEESDFSKLCDKLGIKDKVFLLGKLPKNKDDDYTKYPPDEVLKLYKESFMFVFSSLVEGCPNVVLEAIASLKPIVAAKSPGTIDFVTDYKNGLFYEPRNVNEMADKIVEIIKNKRLYNDMVNFNKLDREKYSWKNVAAKYLEMYNSVS